MQEQSNEELKKLRKDYGRATKQEFNDAKPATRKKVSSNQKMRNDYGRINMQEYKAITKRAPKKTASK